MSVTFDIRQIALSVALEFDRNRAPQQNINDFTANAKIIEKFLCGDSGDDQPKRKTMTRERWREIEMAAREFGRRSESSIERLLLDGAIELLEMVATNSALDLPEDTVAVKRDRLTYLESLEVRPHTGGSNGSR